MIRRTRRHGVAHGLPLRVLVTAGPMTDCTQAAQLMTGFEADAEESHRSFRPRKTRGLYRHTITIGLRCGT